MLLQPQFAETRHRVDRRDFIGSSVGIERQRYRHQAANQVGIAVAAKVKDFSAASGLPRFAFDPDLADAASDAVEFVSRRIVQRFERSPELDHIAVAIFPVF